MQNLNHACRDTPPTKMEVINSDYQRLDHNSTQIDEETPQVVPNSLPKNHNQIQNHNNYVNRRWVNSRSTWLMIVIGALIAVSVIAIIKHFGPSFMKKVIPAVHWLVESCSHLELASVVFAAIALFPILLLPTVPFKWIAGMIFGYGIGFLLITAGVAVAVSLPYVIASCLFLHKIENWLDKYPEKAALVRLAGDGDWLHQFQAVVLLRLSPFPYVIFNYVAVVTGVKYSPYLAGTLIGMVPEILFAIYSGRMLRTMAEAMEEHTHVSKFQMMFDGIGFCLAAASTISIGFYAKQKLEELKDMPVQQQLQ
ncbi:uncharacterized protein LOC130811068 isoform X2 [Amaranthus tricolor]|uniref:uncharacterized protein LOC130811068 isoform X2 n=1 Tax=Amaranthus tricolor TaxID=29722 RepID=UPI0025835BEC|nr:uncharacterized protein LOC130811068 isoform X2 [Amaranthus tricolor]